MTFASTRSPTWPNFCQHRAFLVESGPPLTTHRANVNRDHPHSVELVAKLAKMQLNFAGVAQSRSKPSQTPPTFQSKSTKIGGFRAEFGPIRADSGRNRADLARSWPNLDELGSNLVGSVGIAQRIWADFAQQLGRIAPKSAQIAQSGLKPGPICPVMGQVWPNRPSSRRSPLRDGHTTTLDPYITDPI